jgi:hypothetical protein
MILFSDGAWSVATHQDVLGKILVQQVTLLQDFRPILLLDSY